MHESSPADKFEKYIKHIEISLALKNPRKHDKIE